MGTKWGQLLDLYDTIDGDKSFAALRQPGIKLVRGDGPQSVESARVMVICRPPSAAENGAGKPFVGRAGRILDGLLALAGFHRGDVFVTPYLKYRLPSNEAPSPYYCFKVAPYLEEERSILDPVLTIALGSAAHNYFDSLIGISAIGRGQLWSNGRTGRGEQSWRASQLDPGVGLRRPSMQPTIEEEWTRLWEDCKEVGGILCGLCDGISAREGVGCDNCNPSTYPEPG